MKKLSHEERSRNTKSYFLGMAPSSKIFEVVRKDGKAAKVGYFVPMPRDYDNKKCLPWTSVRGRYQIIKK